MITTIFTAPSLNDQLKRETARLSLALDVLKVVVSILGIVTVWRLWQ